MRRSAPQEHPFPSRPCSSPDCNEIGRYPAPTRNGTKINKRPLLCLEHARQANRMWNYYRGFTGDQIVADQQFDRQWRRPTRAGLPANTEHPPSDQPTEPTIRCVGGERESWALKTLGIEETATLNDIKNAYKKRAKQLHPDTRQNNAANTTDLDGIQRLNAAYQTLRTMF